LSTPLSKPQFVTDETGRRIAVILPMAEYEEMAEMLEDLADAEEIERRRSETGIPHEEAMRLVEEGDAIPD
jgi:PHD/YefM family antitoxin component YafN of YafNO toxin-antitoxin module